MSTTDTTTRIWSLGYLAEMIGDCTPGAAAIARDALIGAGLLDWTGDRDGGWLHDPDGRFMAVACAALGPASISWDNGQTAWTAADLTSFDLSDVDMDRVLGQAMAYMDDDIREAVHSAMAPCSAVEFIAAYLGHPRATDIVIG